MLIESRKVAFAILFTYVALHRLKTLATKTVGCMSCDSFWPHARSSLTPSPWTKAHHFTNSEHGGTGSSAEQRLRKHELWIYL